MTNHKFPFTLVLAASMALTACGSAGSPSPAPAAGGESINTETPVVQASPTPSPAPSPSPSCKPLRSSWMTSDTVPTILQGTYVGPANSNSPDRTLDLTNAFDGQVAFPLDQTYQCYYDVTVGAGFYRLNAFNGCSIAQAPQPYPQNENCSYCPFRDNAVRTFTYSLSCSSLTITSPSNEVTTYQ